MKECINNIKFPIVNISLVEWNNDIVEEVFREDDIYYSGDKSFFNKYLLLHKFVDVEGNVFRITGKEPIKGILLNLFKQKKSKILFEPLNIVMSFEALQQLMIERITKLDGEDAKSEWIHRLEGANNIEELL